MSLIASQYDPSGQFFASVILSLDSHVVRVQSSTSSSTANKITNSLQSFSTVFPLSKGLKVAKVQWIPNTITGSVHANKKQKKVIGSLEDQLLCILFENSNFLYIYSPTANEILKTVKLTSNLVSFQYDSNKFWGLDLHNKLFEFDDGFEQIRSINLNNYVNDSLDNVHFKNFKYLDNEQLILSSSSLYLLQDKMLHQLNSNHINEIEEIKLINDDKYVLTYTKNDRFINCLDIKANQLVKIYVTETAILKVDYFKNEEFKIDLLAALTDSGNVEIFNDPFSISNDKQIAAASSKYNRRKNIKKSVCSNQTIKIARPAGQISEKLIFENIKLNNKFVILSWLEDSSIPFFHHLQWWDNKNNGEKIYTINEPVELLKEKPNLRPFQNLKHGHDIASAKHYNESHAIVSSGDNVRDLGKDEDEEDEEDDLSLAERLQLQSQNGTMANGSSTVKQQKKKAKAGTLTVVLIQALKSNDHSLLETVLNNKDESIIRNTIYKMDSAYIVALLDRLSERISRNGNRQLNLNYWIKNILIYHGNYLINHVNNKNSNLNNLISVLSAKSRNLGRLMELRGKIGMVTDRLELKRDMMKALQEQDEAQEDEIEENVEYIEELDDAGLLDGEDEEMMELSDEEHDLEDEIEAELDEQAIEDGIELEEQYSDIDDYDDKVKDIAAGEKHEDADNEVIEKVKEIKKRR